MNDTLLKVTEWLLTASSRITQEYVLLPIANGEDRYRERVYCYELYHQWRCQWMQAFRYQLSGELDKRGHTLVKGKHLDSCIPDFLVHTPGDMENLIAMEVKPANREPKDFVRDLEKLTAFRRSLVDQDERPANYEAAFFWIYGLSKYEWPKRREDILEAVTGNSDVQLDLIRVFLHENPKSRAIEVHWE